MAESLMKLEAVIDRVGFKSSKIYALMAGDDFPRPVKIGSASRWVASEVDEWIGRQIAER